MESGHLRLDELGKHFRFVVEVGAKYEIGSESPQRFGNPEINMTFWSYKGPMISNQEVRFLGNLKIEGDV